MKKVLITVAGILALSTTLALPTAAAPVRSDEVSTQNLQFVHPLGQTRVDLKLAPPAELQQESREHVAIGLLLPAVQRVRCSC